MERVVHGAARGVADTAFYDRVGTFLARTTAPEEVRNAVEFRRRITSYNVCYTKLLRFESPHPKERAISAERCLETYLQEINEVSLLTADEEQELGRRIQAGDLGEAIGDWSLPRPPGSVLGPRLGPG